MYNYLDDSIAVECLKLAKQCKTGVGFGAVLVRDGKILGKGRNRWATNKDRKRLSHVDYAIHAEQSAILDAIDNGYEPNGDQIYVLGIALRGKKKGTLTVRQVPTFICSKCPPSLLRYNLSVNIPYYKGWYNLTAEEAMTTGKETANKGYWVEFAK